MLSFCAWCDYVEYWLGQLTICQTPVGRMTFSQMTVGQLIFGQKLRNPSSIVKINNDHFIEIIKSSFFQISIDKKKTFLEEKNGDICNWMKNRKSDRKLEMSMNLDKWMIDLWWCCNNKVSFFFQTFVVKNLFFLSLSRKKWKRMASTTAKRGKVRCSKKSFF